ncbi:hypothetical protein [Serratia ficaria]|uniref:hypothetical protein n=1 Tax=Serratia ficaria TaxID=61651 RepID=UPI00217C4DD8|nr:hypothetical protein [Serratia ficaria]CAI1150768.1 Uncharacterised protein [Serratia ficaria]CAI2008952.1 Uncharacterised protein [Serratia ficaria]CAI2518524.1 Uncharacterised protein [Serratia ficaria]
MELFVISSKLPLRKRIKLAITLFNGVMAILCGDNWSLKFRLAEKKQTNGLSFDAYQDDVTSQDVLIVLADSKRSILSD